MVTRRRLTPLLTQVVFSRSPFLLFNTTSSRTTIRAELSLTEILGITSRLGEPRVLRRYGTRGQVASPSIARHVVDVHVHARRDVSGRQADRAAGLDDRFAGSDCG